MTSFRWGFSVICHVSAASLENALQLLGTNPPPHYARGPRDVPSCAPAQLPCWLFGVREYLLTQVGPSTVSPQTPPPGCTSGQLGQVGATNPFHVWK